MRVLPVAKRKSRRAPGSGHFLRKVCKKSKGYSGHGQFGLLRDAPKLAPGGQLPSIVEKKHVFRKKYVFFTKHVPPVPRGRRLLMVALMMQLSMRPVPAFFDFCILQTFLFFCPVSVFLAQKGPPNEFFCTFFGRVFGRARVQIS